MNAPISLLSPPLLFEFTEADGLILLPDPVQSFDRGYAGMQIIEVKPVLRHARSTNFAFDFSGQVVRLLRTVWGPADLRCGQAL